jgi:hypothetical protein
MTATIDGKAWTSGISLALESAIERTAGVPRSGTEFHSPVANKSR